jgi:hypothetical protein
MKHRIFRVGGLCLGACLGFLGCDYGRGTVRHQADGQVTNTGDDLRSSISNTGRSPILPGTWSKQGQEIENSLAR